MGTKTLVLEKIIDNFLSTRGITYENILLA